MSTEDEVDFKASFAFRKVLKFSLQQKWQDNPWVFPPRRKSDAKQKSSICRVS